jgi:hypothetical protein
MHAIEPPAGVEGIVAPMRWLLEHAGDEITLTQSNYIARPLVLDAIERFDWWDWKKPPHSEADVPQVDQLREAAQARHLIRRRGKKLLATAKGRALVGDPFALWQQLALTLGGTDDFGLMVAELIGLRLLDGIVVGSEGLADALGPIIVEQGWRAGGESLSHRDVSWAIAQRLYWWRVLGLVDEERPHYVEGLRTGDYCTALNERGEATVLAFLRSAPSGHEIRYATDESVRRSVPTAPDIACYGEFPLMPAPSRRSSTTPRNSPIISRTPARPSRHGRRRRHPCGS